MAYGVDILIKSIEANLVCVEVKRSVAELQKLITIYERAVNAGPTRKTTAAFRKTILNTSSAPSTSQPIFWGRADAEVCFRMNMTIIHRTGAAGLAPTSEA